MKISDVKPGMRIIDEGVMTDRCVLLKIESVTSARVRAIMYGYDRNSLERGMSWQKEGRTRKLCRPLLVADHLTDDEVINKLSALNKDFQTAAREVKERYESAISDFVSGSNP